MYPVPTLPLPDGTETDLLKLAGFEGVRLFVDRARLMLPSFALDAGNAQAVLSICRRLDGIPLAIELAAARLKMLTPMQIAERLSDRFRLLSSSERAVLPRQKTLRALIDWSYDLLSEAECAVLRRVAVFRGGWHIEAARAVCCDIERDTAGLLAQMIDKSLILTEAKAQTHYFLLETIREYACERLIAADEAESVGARHFNYFLQFVEAIEPRLWGRELVMHVDAIKCEHDNLRAAAVWVLKNGTAEERLRLGAALGRFWRQLHHIQEGADYLLAALTASAEANVILRARCACWAGEFMWRKGEDREGRLLLEQARTLYQSIAHQAGIADAMMRLSIMAIYRGDLDVAKDLCEETIVCARQANNIHALLGAVNSLGEVARLRSDFAAARACYEETGRLAEQVGDIRALGIVSLNSGLVSIPLGKLAAARDDLIRAYKIFVEIGEQPNQPYVLEGLAGIEAAKGRLERAVCLYAAMESLCVETQVSLYGDDQRQHQQAVQALRQRLPEACFTSAWQSGQGLNLSEAVQVALE